MDFTCVFRLVGTKRSSAPKAPDKPFFVDLRKDVVVPRQAQVAYQALQDEDGDVIVEAPDPLAAAEAVAQQIGAPITSLEAIGST